MHKYSPCSLTHPTLYVHMKLAASWGRKLTVLADVPSYEVRSSRLTYRAAETPSPKSMVPYAAVLTA